jgi:hypothetical protein
MSSILDFLFGGNNAAQTKPAAPQQFSSPGAAAGTATFPDQQSWLQNYAKTAGDVVRAQRPITERGLLNWLTGRDANVASEVAGLQGPAAYFKMLEAQPDFTAKNTAAQSGQLGLMQRLAQTGLISDQDVDPNNILSALPAYLKAMRQQFPDLTPSGQTQAAPVPGMAAPPQGATPLAPSAQPPVSVAPLPPPQGASAAPLNPVQPQPQQSAAPNNAAPPSAPFSVNPELTKQRALFDRLGRFQTLFGNPADATKFFDLARKGIPEGSTVLNGSTVEGVSGNPLTMPGQNFEAQGAGLKATATELPHVAGQQAIDAYNAGLQRTTTTLKTTGERDAHIAETNNEKQQTPVTGYSTVNGQPMIAPASALKDGLPNFAPGANPYVEKHAKELEAGSKDAQDAAQGIIQAQQLVEAAQGILTGAWGEDIQDIRRGLSTLGIASPKLMTAAKKGDVVNELGTELAALRARAATGGRVPMSTFQIFRSVKPGLMSTNPAAVAAPIIASFQRQLDFADFQSKYYNDPNNWNKLDAVNAFRATNPDQKYIDAAQVPEPAPAVGTIVDGHRFKGGNPNAKESWEQVH